MKRLLSIICFSVLLLATAKAQSDSNLVIHKLDKTQYIIISPSDLYIDSLIRDIAGDEEEMDNFYVAMDDLGYYLYLCDTLLRQQGTQPLFSDSDSRIFLADEQQWLSMPSRGFSGVLVYQPDGSYGLFPLLEFIGTLTTFDEETKQDGLE
ncbi:MAG: hypothetical protein J6X86_05530 [Bacteroidales bacterium]|nr:hypothetical protein [Bacteroidales bacterium]